MTRQDEIREDNTTQPRQNNDIPMSVSCDIDERCKAASRASGRLLPVCKAPVQRQTKSSEIHAGVGKKSTVILSCAFF
jgi:hypothetical protein